MPAGTRLARLAATASNTSRGSPRLTFVPVARHIRDAEPNRITYYATTTLAFGLLQNCVCKATGFSGLWWPRSRFREVHTLDQ